MQKINYFEALEELCISSQRVVFLSLENSRPRLTNSLKECEKIQQDAIDTLCALELSLFAEFLPPLERNTIAELAHSLMKIIEKSIYIMCQKIQRPTNDKKQKYSSDIKTLSAIIEESVFVLKKIKKPNQTPDIATFRKTLTELRKSTRQAHKKQNFHAFLAYELCEELSNCFDKMIEIMLCNL